MRLTGLNQKVRSRSGDVTVPLRGQSAAGVQNGPKSPTQSSETRNVETPYFRFGASEQAKPQGTLLEVRE